MRNGMSRIDFRNVAIYDVIVNYISEIISETRYHMASDEISRKRVSDIPPFGLRLQPDLKRQLEEKAKAGARSLNAEIVGRLEYTLAAGITVQKTGFDVEHGATDMRIRELEERVAALEGQKRKKG
jgi:hypothetical protein